MKGGAKVVIEAHRHEGVFIARSKEDALVTLNSTPGKDVYGEKRIQVEGPPGPEGVATKLEYRVWNPFRSKLAAAILGGVDHIWMGPGSKVLYLGAASGTTVSHVSDIVGPTGCVYAVEFSHRPGRDLINMAKLRTNVIPIVEDARHPLKYRMLGRLRGLEKHREGRWKGFGFLSPCLLYVGKFSHPFPSLPPCLPPSRSRHG